MIEQEGAGLFWLDKQPRKVCLVMEKTKRTEKKIVY
jgi:hypothetical protein